MRIKAICLLPESLKELLWMLTEQPLLGFECPELQPNMRSLSIESHTLFYRVAPNAVEIIRILHGAKTHSDT